MALTNGPNLGVLVDGGIGEVHYDALMKQWRAMDALTQANIISASISTPPSTPSDGDLYIVPSGSTGVWSGNTNKLARYSSKASSWEYYTPKNGWLVYNKALGTFFKFNGTIWVEFLANTQWGNITGNLVDQTDLQNALDLKLNSSAVGTIASQNADSVSITGGSISGITDLAVADGGTGASTAPAARNNLGLGDSATKNVGTIAGTVCAGDDSRLSNSREWSAATVDQTEAEAGTATTRRAWTAQRVRQAIAAWWSGVTNIDGKAIGQTTPAAGKFTNVDTTTRYKVLALTGPGYGEMTRSQSSGGLAVNCSNGPEIFSFYDFNFPEIYTVGGLIRFFRATNTTGDCSLNIYAGNGTNTIVHSFSSKGAAMFCNNGGIADFRGGMCLSVISSTAVSGSTVTLTSNTTQLVYDQAATVAALTVELPSSPINGQIIAISTRSAITALTVSGGTIYGAPTSLSAGGFCQFIYQHSANAWFRRG